MEDEEGYMVLDRRSKQGAAGSPPPRQSAAPGCPRWHRAALGAGWTGNLLLGVAVVALGCSFFHQQAESPGSSKNRRVGNGCSTVENFILDMREALCPSQPYGAEECRACPAGWTLGGTKCYWISTGYGPWNKSREDCGVRGAELLLPRDQDELELLNETLQKPGRYFWIGLCVPAAGTGWTWLNGSHLDRDRFLLKERPGKCGTIRGNSIVPDNCDLELQWICQREATEF